MLRLAHLALAEALEALPANCEVPLFLALPESLPDRPPPADESFLDLLATQTGAPLDKARSQVFPTGRAAGFQALGEALKLLKREAHAFVLVGGVDSYLDLYLLGTLDRDDRVLADGVMDGFAPGEGAGFLLVAGQAAAGKLAAPPAVQVHQPGLGVEPGHRYSQAPYQGDGLSDAIASALDNAGAPPVQTVLAGFNGENFGAKEWGVAFSRCQGKIAPGFAILHPADGYGDLGAAVGPVLIGLAAVGLTDAYMRGPCLAWASSDAAGRGATCITSIHS
jgi:3-oxoacyl-[acyl-carrier-protein] synthase-1